MTMMTCNTLITLEASVYQANNTTTSTHTHNIPFLNPQMLVN